MKIALKKGVYYIIKILAVTGVLLALVGCETFIFFPKKTLLYNPMICERQPKDYVIEAEDGTKLHSWLFRTTKEKKGVIVFMHGNSRNIGTETAHMLWVLDYGYDLFTFDYRGYGISEGEPSIKGVLNDGVDAIDALMEIEPLDKSNMILYGQSLGGAVAAYSAVNSKHADKFKALVLDSTFTSWHDMAQEIAARMVVLWPFQYPVAATFSKYGGSEAIIKDSKIPHTIIMHSTKDPLMGIQHAERLYTAANDPKDLIISVKSKHARMIYEARIRGELLQYLDSYIQE